MSAAADALMGVLGLQRAASWPTTEIARALAYTLYGDPVPMPRARSGRLLDALRALDKLEAGE
jgi:hypothetical protein